MQQNAKHPIPDDKTCQLKWYWLRSIQRTPVQLTCASATISHVKCSHPKQILARPLDLLHRVCCPAGVNLANGQLPANRFIFPWDRKQALDLFQCLLHTDQFVSPLLRTFCSKAGAPFPRDGAAYEAGTRRPRPASRPPKTAPARFHDLHGRRSAC